MGAGLPISGARACVNASPAPELRSTLQLRDFRGGVRGGWPACEGAVTASPCGEYGSRSGAGAGPRGWRGGPVQDIGLSSPVQRGRLGAPAVGVQARWRRPLSVERPLGPRRGAALGLSPPVSDHPGCGGSGWFAVVVEPGPGVKPLCELTCRAGEAPCPAGSEVRHLFASV